MHRRSGAGEGRRSPSCSLRGDGIQQRTAHGKAGLSVLVRNAQGRGAQELAQAASMRNNGTTPVPEAGGYSFTIQRDGELAKVYVSVSGSDAMLITVYGENAQTRSILQSIRKK